MSDHHDYLGTESDTKFRLRADVLMLMLKGAGYAAVFCLVLWFGLMVLYWIGQALPEESRDTPDPGQAFLQQPYIHTEHV
ncbi:RC-LH1 core complex protein PufX [Planktomarina sp.]|uniref:RC-LH1 core complex protein PufX n=1 Tax=Planktomarina sp. TaxID=2024851 RepID=UPI003261B0C6